MANCLTPRAYQAVKRQEGMQLNVNRQTAKCKVLLKINRRTQQSNRYGWFYSKNRSVYYKLLFLLACPVAASRLDKPLVT